MEEDHLGVAGESLGHDTTSIDQHVAGLNLFSELSNSAVCPHRRSVLGCSSTFTSCQKNSPSQGRTLPCRRWGVPSHVANRARPVARCLPQLEHPVPQLSASWWSLTRFSFQSGWTFPLKERLRLEGARKEVERP